MAEGVPTNNQRGRRSGPCRLWGGLDKARHIVPTALLVRVQCFRKSLHKAVQGPSTRPIVVSMINGSYCRRLRRLTIFEPDEMKFGVSETNWMIKNCRTFFIKSSTYHDGEEYGDGLDHLNNPQDGKTQDLNGCEDVHALEWHVT